MTHCERHDNVFPLKPVKGIYALYRTHPGYFYVVWYYYLRYLRGDSFKAMADEAGLSGARVREVVRWWRWRLLNRLGGLDKISIADHLRNDLSHRDVIVAALAGKWNSSQLPEFERSQLLDPIERLIDECRRLIEWIAVVHSLTLPPPRIPNAIESLPKTVLAWVRRKGFNDHHELMACLRRHHGFEFDINLTATIAESIRNFVIAIDPKYSEIIDPDRTRAVTEAARRARDRRKRAIAPAAAVTAMPISAAERQLILSQIKEIERGTAPPYEGVHSLDVRYQAVITALSDRLPIVSALTGNGYIRTNRHMSFEEQINLEEFIKTFLLRLDMWLETDVVDSIIEEVFVHGTILSPFLIESLLDVLNNAQPIYFLNIHAQHALDLAYEAKFGRARVIDDDEVTKEMIDTRDVNASLQRMTYLGDTVHTREILYRWMLSRDSAWN